MSNAVKRSCNFCGEQFESSFDEARHHAEAQGQTFDPKYYLNEKMFIELGTLLHKFYESADNPKAVRDTADEVYNMLLLAEQNPYWIVRTKEEVND